MSKIKTGSIILDGDKRCSNRCTFCPGIVDESISVDAKYSKFILESNFFINNGYKKIEISGSDPIHFSKLSEAIRHLKDNGISEVCLSTHGRNFKNLSFVKNLQEAGLDSVRIPLYGSESDTHNKIMQYSANRGNFISQGNAFEEVVEGILNCSKLGLVVSGHSLLTQYNRSDLGNIIDLYLKLTKGNMGSLIISSAGISQLNYEYTGEWYLPIKDAGKYLKNILNHRIKSDFPHIYFKIFDFPFCSIEAINFNMFNLDTLPDIGEKKVSKKLRSENNDNVPHYRVKKHFKECLSCVANKICSGILSNDEKLFGTGDLKAITNETIINQTYY